MKEMQFLKDLEYVRTGGSKEELKAANYIKKNLEDLGLKPTIENFEVQEAKIIKASLEVVEPYKQKIDCLGVMCSKDTSGLTKNLYYYRGSVDDTCNDDIKDKIILVDSAMPYWTYKKLIEKGAAGFISCNGLLIDENKDIDQKELRGPLRELGEIPGVEINIKDGFDMIQKGATKVKIVLKQEPKKGQSRNVVCKIKGSEDPTIVFTAHYDSTSLSKGSYDNATGSLGIFKIAEYYSKVTPRHNLVFVWCGSEERGLLGSKAYVKKHKKELDNIGLCINLDMIGTTLGSFLACVTGEMKLVNYIEYMSKERGFALKPYQDVYSSDSTPFADNGVPAVSFARITNYSPIHCRYDDMKMLNETMIKEDIKFILDFTRRMDDSIVLPVNRIIPDNMKEQLDYYMLRKKRERK